MKLNGHTHLELDYMRNMCPKQPMSFHKWMKWMVIENRKNRAIPKFRKLIIKGIESSIDQLVSDGTTKIGDVSQLGLSYDVLKLSGLSGVVFLEVIGLQESRWKETFDFVKTKVYQELNANGKIKIGIFVHALYSTHPWAVWECYKLAKETGIPISIHVLESPDEARALNRRNCDLLDLVKELAGMPPPELNITPLQSLDRLGILKLNPLLVHMTNATNDDFELVAKNNAKIVHCPRSNFLLKCGRFRLEKALALNIPVFLGTDSLASSPSLDVAEECSFAIDIHRGKVDGHVIEKLACSSFFP